MFKRFTLAALAAASISALVPTQAQAQTARYCDGRINAVSFYSTVQSERRRTVLSYFVVLQSMGDEIRYSVTFDARRQATSSVTEAQNGSFVGYLASNQQVTILLGKQAFTHPGGTGLINASEMVQYTTVSCVTPRRRQPAFSDGRGSQPTPEAYLLAALKH